MTAESLLENQIRETVKFCQELRGFAKEQIDKVRVDLKFENANQRLEVVKTVTGILEQLTKSVETLTKCSAALSAAGSGEPREAAREMTEAEMIEFLKG